MKVLLISDSHGKGDMVHKIVNQLSDIDHVIHCGDFCTSKQKLPKTAFTFVKGNCDFEDAPEEVKWKADDIQFYITHGHRYHVKKTMIYIRKRAENVGAHIACFGHSHIPFCKKIGKILLVNPGSITHPRVFSAPTYACIQLNNKEVKVSYFKTNGQLISQFGGTFHLG